MSQSLCPDVQSPEISVACPDAPASGSLFTPPSVLPDTGSDLIFFLFHLALLAVLLGVAIHVWRQST